MSLPSRISKNSVETQALASFDLTAFFDLSPDLFCIIKPDGEIQTANPAWSNTLGWLPSELSLHSWIELIHPEDITNIKTAIALSNNAEPTKGLECRLRHQNGSERWISWSVSRSQTGLIYAVGRDISDRKQQEESLKNERQELYNLLDQLPAFLYLQPKDYSVGFYNQQFREIFGNPQGRRCYQTIANRKEPCSICPTFQVFDTKTPQIWEWVDSNNQKTYQIYDYPFTGSNGQPMVVEMGLDITALKQAEAALRNSEAQLREKNQALQESFDRLRHTQAQLIHSEKMSSIGQMVGGVAHEINNPISFIYGNIDPAIDYTSQVLKLIFLYQKNQSNSSAEIQEYLEEIDFDFVKKDFPRLLSSLKEGASRIKETILSLRNFSRFQEAEIKKVDLHAGINSTLMILRHRLQIQSGKPPIKIIQNLGDLPLVECEPSQINQVFLNILNNAIDALAEKVEFDTDFIPTIHISTKIVPSNPSHKPERIAIRIADNGLGIPAELQSRLFEPFFTTKPIGKGTGLGLSISHQIIVKSHNGSLKFNSHIGQGTEFTIELGVNMNRQEEGEE